MNIGEPVHVLGVIIPAWNAAGHIEEELISISAGFDSAADWSFEVIVFDDGITNGEALSSAFALFSRVRLLRHNHNRGIRAARNTSISDSLDDFVTLLDADDGLVTDWLSACRSIMDEWPEHANICLTPCINHAGERTCARSDFKGSLIAEDMVLEHLFGE